MTSRPDPVEPSIGPRSRHADRAERRANLVVYGAAFALLVAVNWVFPLPMSTFLDTISPGHGRELAYDFLTAALRIVGGTLLVMGGLVALMHILIQLVDWWVDRRDRMDRPA